MKTLKDYVNDAQTAIFNQYGIFFAFSNQQFAEKKQEGVKYIAAGMGMIIPVEHLKVAIDALNKVTKKGIALDIEENGYEAIIKRELNDHECYYTSDISDAVRALKKYGIKQEQIMAVFNGEPFTPETTKVRKALK